MRSFAVALVWILGLASSVSADQRIFFKDGVDTDLYSATNCVYIHLGFGPLALTQYDSSYVLNEHCVAVSVRIDDSNCAWEIIHTINAKTDDDDQPYSSFFVRFISGTEPVCRSVTRALVDWWLPDTSDSLFESRLTLAGVTEYFADIGPIYDADFTDVERAIHEFYRPSYSVKGVNVTLQDWTP
ncbi:MAG: hypothetical protein PHI73_00700 [Patescibacteria group bacterium]|nr:hypothetical protein [Patescibacteria group bacterium]